MRSEKYVLFDLFDTLVLLNKRARLSAIHHTYTALPASQHAISIERWTACFDETLNAFNQQSNTSLDEFSMHQVIVQVQCILNQPNADAERLHQAFAEAWIDQTELNQQLTVFLKSGIPFSILTNTSSTYILQHCIDRYPEIFDHAEHVFASIVFGKRKPHPDFYTHAARTVGREHSEIIVVGDNLQCDFLTPRQIGMQAFLLNPEKNSLADVVDFFGIGQAHL